MTDATDAQLAAQYEAYPYPKRDPRDEAKRLIIGSPSHLREIDHCSTIICAANGATACLKANRASPALTRSLRHGWPDVPETADLCDPPHRIYFADGGRITVSIT